MAGLVSHSCHLILPRRTGGVKRTAPSPPLPSRDTEFETTVDATTLTDKIRFCLGPLLALAGFLVPDLQVACHGHHQPGMLPLLHTLINFSILLSLLQHSGVQLPLQCFLNALSNAQWSTQEHSSPALLQFPLSPYQAMSSSRAEAGVIIFAT